MLKEININSGDLMKHLKILVEENSLPDGVLVSTAGLALRLRHLLNKINLGTTGRTLEIARFGEDLPYFPTGMIQIRQPHEALGQRAAQKLLAQIDGANDKDTANIEILPMEVIDETQHD